MRVFASNFGIDIEAALNASEQQWKEEDPSRVILIEPWMQEVLGISGADGEPIRFSNTKNIVRKVGFTTKDGTATVLLKEIEFASNRTTETNEVVPTMSRIIYAEKILPESM